MNFVEDLAPYIELTEEEQMKLLQEYENEMKTKHVSPSKENTKEIPHSSIPFACDNSSKNTNLQQELLSSEMKSMNKENSAISLHNTSSSSSTDGDWEKISDVDK